VLRKESVLSARNDFREYNLTTTAAITHITNAKMALMNIYN
jgi:hypothetical protein